jgi:hypothetical protein
MRLLNTHYLGCEIWNQVRKGKKKEILFFPALPKSNYEKIEYFLYLKFTQHMQLKIAIGFVMLGFEFLINSLQFLIV